MEGDINMLENEHQEKEKIAGVITSDFLSDFFISTGSNILPLRNPVLLTEDIEIAPIGGLVVQKTGKYLVSFSFLSSSLLFSIPIELSVFVTSRYLGSVSNSSPDRLTNFVTIEDLKKGDVVYVLVTSGPMGVAPTVAQITLTVAKLDQ